MRLISLLILSNLFSCVTLPPQIVRNPLAKEILRFRTGLKNPSNRACVAWDSKNNCSKEENLEYDLRLPETRKLLISLDFICKVGGHRYKIDPGTAQLRHDDVVKCGLFGWGKCRKSDFIDVEKVDFLRQANTKCFSAKMYSFDQVN